MRVFAAGRLENWNEIRTAGYVARLGTISAAAEALGVHRATVTRHVDALEAALGAKLFQRHARGFTPTELGRELLRIADATNTHFSALQRIAKGQSDELSGELTVTSLDVLVPLILPVLNGFQDQNPKVAAHLVSSDRVLKLEYGEADIAFRIGPKPQHPDNVVLPALTLRTGLYASSAYIARHGHPRTPSEFSAHRFVGPDREAPRTPYLDWLMDAVPADRICLRSNSIKVIWDAVSAGSGIGFAPEHEAQDRGLVAVLPPREDWCERVWAVTHVDLHRTPKVQAFVRMLKQMLTGK